MAVIASATGAAVFGLGAGTLAAGLAGGALLGAGAGALYSGISGDGDILNSALTGALLGGAVGGLGASFGPGLMSKFGSGAATTSTTPALTAAQTTAQTAAQTAAANTAPGFAYTPAGEMVSAAYPASVTGATNVAGFVPPSPVGIGAQVVPTVEAGLTGKEKLGYGLAATTALSMLSPKNKLNAPPGSPSYIRPFTYSAKQNAPGDEYPAPYPSTPLYNAQGNPILDTRERDYFTQSYTAGEPYRAAQGGLMSAGGPVERMSQMNMAINPQGGMYPQGMIDKTQYALPTQRPTSMEVLNAIPQRMFANGGITYDAATQRYAGLPSPSQTPVEQLPADLVALLTPQYQAANPNLFSYDAKNQRYGAGMPSMAQLNSFKAIQDQKAAEEAAAAQSSQGYAMGGNVQRYNLGGYSDGGRLLKGPGDGVSDDIPAVIGNRQPARLADGEFVIPARIVSEIGNGSTDAGAKRLYAMMDKIQAGRKKTVGKNNVAKDSKARKHLLA
jgi:hypothetical protein